MTIQYAIEYSIISCSGCQRRHRRLSPSHCDFRFYDIFHCHGMSHMKCSWFQMAPNVLIAHVSNPIWCRFWSSEKNWCLIDGVNWANSTDVNSRCGSWEPVFRKVEAANDHSVALKIISYFCAHRNDNNNSLITMNYFRERSVSCFFFFYL